jgi:chorismate-pyruvate lyase
MPMNRWLRCCLLFVLCVGTASLLGCSSVVAREPARHGWPDTPLGRTQALAVLQTLNADLLSHASATLTLERWCADHHLASPARVIAQRVHGIDKPLPAALGSALHVGASEPVKYRRVLLSCGDHVLSEADNWYLPRQLTAAMNDRLDHSDAPFGKVVQPLHFRRETLSAHLLWSPLPQGWEMADALPPSGTGDLAIPHQLLQHRAVLRTGDNQPFSVLIETYTDQVLTFRRELH